MTNRSGITTGVDIVVPIYNARHDVERCVASILRHASGDWRLVLVDDASTDEGLIRFLRATADQNERAIYVRNDVNGGFVVTANRGMREAGGRDVLLLNSDTIVTPRFIEKHIACVYRDDDTGIATPFTNNGTICSIPEFCRDNELPAELTVDEYAELVEAVSPRAYPEIVTAIGFCMYVRATVIEQIGVFDERSFGRGFGEENDFCERAKQRGWKIRLVDDCFVAHTGKASFGDEGRALEHENSRTLARMHPNYFADVAKFCAENPLSAYQDRIRFELARYRMRRYPAALFVLHAPMTDANCGGTEFFVRGLVESLALPRAVVVWPDDREMVVLEIDRGCIGDGLTYRFELSHAPDFFCRTDDEIETTFESIVSLFDVAFVHIHHLIRWPIDIWRNLEKRGIPFVFTIHDYYSVCPSWNLVNRRSGESCPCAGSGDESKTRDCIAAQFAALDLGPPVDADETVALHRKAFEQLFRHARIIFAPSQAAADVVREYYGETVRDVRVIGHGYDWDKLEDVIDSDLDSSSPRNRKHPLKVAILGQVAYPAKGADTYLSLMDRTRDMRIEWHVFGAIDVFGYRRRLSDLNLGERLVVHGNYHRDEIVGLLRKQEIDLSLFLPQVAETFCFTLSESWMASVPAIVSRLGALPERVNETGGGVIVDSIDDALERLRELASEPQRLAPIREAARQFRHPTVAENAQLHREAYGDALQPLTIESLPATFSEADYQLFQAHQRQLAHDRAGIAPPNYHTRWWYPHYMRIKPMIPPTWRGFLKRAYHRLRSAGAVQS